MAEGRIDIKEDASPTKFLASQTHTHGVDTVHAEEVVIVDSAGNVINATANRLHVDGSGVNQPVTDAGGSLTVDALNLDIRDLVHTADSVRIGDGTDLALVSAAGALHVDVQASVLPTGAATAANQLPDSHNVTVDNAGGASAVNVQDGGNTLTVDGTVNIGTFPDNEPFNVGQIGGTATVTGGVAGLLAIAGNVAHDGVDAGNPVKIGAKAAGALPTAVAAADRVDSYVDREGRLITRPWGAGDWTQVHFPAANTQATTSKAAGAAGVRHVCTGITAVLAGNTTAPAAAQVNVVLRDGASGAGTIKWQAVITLPAIAGAMNGITRSGLFIVGTAATAMTLEFSGAAGANTFESVSMEGVDITEA